MTKWKVEIISETELLEVTAIFPSAFETLKDIRTIKEKGHRPIIYRQGNSFWVLDGSELRSGRQIWN